MTQVDKLREKGFTGRGFKVALIDSGIDYTHPALGGCFGKDCLVSFGADFVGNKSDDPMDCNGHGTFTAGVVAAQPDKNPLGLSGVAPGVTLGSYRIGDCKGHVDSDAVGAAFIAAKKDGADIISASFGSVRESWPYHPWASIVEGIVEDGIPCILGIGNSHRKGLFAVSSPASARGAITVTSYTNVLTPEIVRDGKQNFTIKNTLNTESGGAIDDAHSWGPNWDLSFKPQFGAPGGNILSTSLTSGKWYHVTSGTSFATPYVAGIYALIGEARGTLNLTLIERLLSATAKPQLFYNRKTFHDYLAPPAQQGAGLVQAYDAAFATALIEPSSLVFNDTDHFTSTLNFTLWNTDGTRTVNYNLSHIPTKTIYVFNTGSDKDSLSADAVDEVVTIKLSESSLTLAPGQSATVDVSPSPPQGLDPQRPALWSGWIAVNGSDGSSLSIPYQGLAGSMREQRVLEPPAGYSEAVFIRGTSRYDEPYRDNKVFYLEKDPEGTIGLEEFRLWFNTVVGCPLVRVNLVNLTDECDENVVGQLPQLGGEWLSAKMHYRDWEGRLNSSYVPEGRYKLVVRALRIFGDVDNEAHYDIHETQSFQIKHRAI